MRIGIRAHDVKADNFEGMVREIAAEGFTCCQLAVPKAVHEIPTGIVTYTPGLASWMKGIFAQNHVDVAVLGCYYNLAVPDEKEYQKTLEVYRRHIAFASWLGAGMVGTETGDYNAEYVPDEFSRSDEALAIFIDRLRPVVETAEKFGVVVAIEPVCRHIVWNAQRARKVLDTIHSPNLQLIFDPVNLLDSSNVREYQKVIGSFLDLCGMDIIAIHAKDFRMENGILKECACGEGVMDYSVLLPFLAKYKPYIQVLLENTAPGTAVPAREYLEEQYKKLCGR
ncbi:MAG: sugar phosphate isomerase/epimerase family protein [Lachnospiraceae bacterium]